MALALTATPNPAKVGDPVTFAGTDFAATTAVTISCISDGLSWVVTSDGGGDFASTALTWTPTRAGTYHFVGKDGTNTKEAVVNVFTSA